MTTVVTTAVLTQPRPAVASSATILPAAPTSAPTVASSATTLPAAPISAPAFGEKLSVPAGHFRIAVEAGLRPVDIRTQERRKRNMEVLSIHVGLYPDGAPLEDTIPAHDPIMQQLEMDLLLHELAGRVSKQQMDIVHLKQGGYGIREIARTQKVPMRRIKELLAEVHDVLLDICYG